MAVTATPLQNITVNGNQFGCFIQFTTTVTGTTADSGSNDGYVAGAGFNGTPSFFNSFFGQPVGSSTTSTFTVNSFANIPPGGPLQVGIWERVGPVIGAPVQVVAVPRSQIIAAGGLCTNYIPNSAPTNNAGPDQTLGGGGGVVTLPGSANDTDGDTLTHSWTQISGPAVTLSGANTLSPSFNAPAQTNQPRTMVFRLSTTDGIASAVTDTVTVTIPAGPNTLPVANAGTDATINAGATTTLNGSATDVDGDPLTYAWTQTAGPSVTITNPTNAIAAFGAPASTGAVQTLTFSLIANDGFGNSPPDTVTFTIPANSPPSVNAGSDATAPGGSAVNLQGSATDPEGNPLTYQWTQTGGPSVALSGATTLTPSFTAPAKTAAPQVLTFSLTANDGTSTSAPDSVEITIPGNAGPTANAGADVTVNGGATVTMNGSGSTDGDGDALTYSWVQTSGPSVTLTGANTATPTFVAPAANGSLQGLAFELTVSDGVANSTASVGVNVNANATPIANAGADATVAGGSNVGLNGSGSDPDNDPITFAWTQTAGPAVTLVGANTPTPTFVAPPKTNAVQNLSFSLGVSDGVATGTDSVDISVTPNVGPTANAGSTATVNGGTTVSLNGSASTDGDGDALTYSWAQTGGPAVTLIGASSATPSFVAPIGTASVQNLTFELTVSDGLGSSTAPVGIDINPNSPPVANAGPDQGPINTGSTVTLNGGASSDPDGNPLTYSWTQVSGPAATLINPTSANPSFVAPNVNGTQNLVFQLIVNDGTLNSPPDTVTIAVRAVGTVTVIQRVVGADGSFSFTSSIAALSGAIATSNGSGQRSATLVPAGSHSLSATDARAAGYAVTSISCNDSDSVANLANRSVAIALSPNENLVCTFTSTNTRDAATVAIANFLTARNTAILSNQPDLQRRIDRLQGNLPSGGSANAFGVPVPGSGKLPFSFALSNGQMRASASLGMAQSALSPEDRAATPFDIWAEANFSSLRYPGHKGRFSIIYTGADYRIGDSAVVGVLAQFDRFARKGGMAVAGAAEGNGWMAGPYATFKLAPELYADVRAAWGASDNRVSPLGTFVDKFDTSRSLYSASLIGQFNLGDATQFTPALGVRYLDEKQKAYTDALGVAIPGQNVGQGDITLRPRLQHNVTLDGGWMLRPFAEVDGIYTFGLGRQTALTNDFRMRIEGGADILSLNGIRASLSGFHDGIGSSGYKSTGVNVTFAVGF